MNLGLRKEEAIYIRDLIIFDVSEYVEENIKKLYGDIDIKGIITQLDIICSLGESVDEEKEILKIIGHTKE
jgi:hypothetical protein